MVGECGYRFLVLVKHRHRVKYNLSTARNVS